MSARGSSPKMASDTVTEPDSLPSREVTFSPISRPLLAFGRRRFRGGRRRARGLGELELAGLRHAGRQLLLHRVAHGDPAALDAGHRAFNQNEAALDIGLHDFQIELGHPIDTEMSGHLFVLEGLTRILAPTGRTVRVLRKRDAVARAPPVPVEGPVTSTYWPRRK